MSDALDKVRRRLWNRARRDGDEKSVKRMRGVKYAVLKNPGDLTDRQSEASGNLRDTDPKGRLHRSWRLRELLRTPPKRPADQARAELNRWVFRASHSRIPEIVELAPEDPPSWARHPRDNRIGLSKRQARGVRQQDQGHHTHGLRLPPREQPHRPDHAPLRRTRHTPAPTKNLTHENSRSLKY